MLEDYKVTHRDAILDNSDLSSYNDSVIFDSNEDIVWSLDEDISDIDKVNAEYDSSEYDSYLSDAKYDNAIDITTDEDETQFCKLNESGPVKVTRNGQIIEGLRINSDKGPAITVKGFSDVIIRNCEIYHSVGQGITFSNADRIKIENVSITFNNSPISVPNPNSEYVNIKENNFTMRNPIILKFCWE